MALLSPQSVTHAGLAPTYLPATSGGDTCPTGSGLLLAVKNGDSVSHTVTLVTPGTVDGLAVADRAIAVGAGVTMLIPVADVYRDRSTGLASITYDGVTSVTVAAIRVG